MSANKMDNIKTIHEEDVDVKNRRVYVFAEIDNDLARKTVESIHFLDSTDGDIHVYFNTPGGEWDDGMAIYSSILHCKNKVIGTVMGACSSMGSVILQACDIRKIYENSSMLLHPGKAAHSSVVGDFIARADFEKKILDIMHRIYYDRMKETIADPEDLPSYKKFVSLISSDKYIFHDEAHELGLVDEIEKLDKEEE